MSKAIVCQNLIKEFTISPNFSHSLKGTIASGRFTRKKKTKFRALDDISFDVEEGEILGIIGPNGSGKSTLLKIISKITTPTKGRVEIFGHVNTLLEVGTGFHPEMTGHENIFLNGSILGLGRQEIKSRYDEIVEFAEISEFLNMPVKHYSSGMYVRLAFAVAAHLDPDILIVDEVLSVGDEAFQKKCMNKMERDIMKGRTVLFVSHNMEAVQRLCNRVILLEKGSIILEGDPTEVIQHYIGTIGQIQSNTLPDPSYRRGNGAFRMTALSLRNIHDHPTSTFTCGSKMEILIDYSSDLSVIPEMDIHLRVKSAADQPLFTCISSIVVAKNHSIPGSGRLICTIAKMPLNTGHYSLELFGYIQGQLADHISVACSFEILPGHFYSSGKLPPPSFKILTEYEWSIQ